MYYGILQPCRTTRHLQTCQAIFGDLHQSLQITKIPKQRLEVMQFQVVATCFMKYEFSDSLLPTAATADTITAQSTLYTQYYHQSHAASGKLL